DTQLSTITQWLLAVIAVRRVASRVRCGRGLSREIGIKDWSRAWTIRSAWDPRSPHVRAPSRTLAGRHVARMSPFSSGPGAALGRHRLPSLGYGAVQHEATPHALHVIIRKR